MDEHILPECFTDTVLIGKLIPPKTRYNHQKGCTTIAKEMCMGRFKDTFAVGIIDKDKKEIKYLEEFLKIDAIGSSLLLWKHKVKHHYIVQVCPALETWIIEVCQEGGIDLQRFGFSPDVRELTRVTKSVTSHKDEKINSLCVAIAKIDDIEKVRKFKAWINYLK